MFILNVRRPTTIITWFLYWLTTCPPMAVTVILPSFSWDPRNDCFSGSKDGAFMEVDQESQLYILCPSVAITDNVEMLITDQKNMYENMFMCTKKEFDDCEVGPEQTVGRTRLVMTCDKPLDPQKLTYQSFSFQQFQSGIDGYAFEAGTTYYFIATSNGTKEGLTNRKGGRCREKNMKLAIKICAQGDNCHARNDKRCNKGGSKERKSALTLQSISTEPPGHVEPPRPTINPCSNVNDPVPTFFPDPQVSRSTGGRESPPATKYMIIIGVGSFIVGIILCLIAITIYKKACRDGAFASAYCCFNRQKMRIDKVTQEPLC